MKIFFKIIIALILALISWEVLLGLTIVKLPGTVNHPVFGNTYKQGLLIWGKEGYSITYINSLGLREKEIASKKDNEFRILSLGDSYAEGFQVPDNKLLTAQLNSLLNKDKSSDKYFNVINAAKSGYSPSYYIHFSDFYKKALAQDYTIAIIMDSDFYRDSFDKNQYIYLSQKDNSYNINVNKDFKSNKLAIFDKYKGFQFLKNYSIVNIGAKNLLHMLNINIGQGGKPKNKKKTDIKKYDPLIEWSILNLKNKYENIVILYLPEIDYDTLEKGKSDYESLTESYCKQYNVSFINMRNDFISYIKQSKQPVHGFFNTKPGEGHINAHAHGLIAKRLHKYFNEKF